MGILIQLIALALFYGVAQLSGNAFYFPPENIATFWPSIGLLTGTLLACKRKHRLGFIGVAIAVQLVIDIGVYERAWWVGICFTGLNILEALIVLFLLRHFARDTRLFSTVRGLFRFIVVGVVFGPAMTAIPGSLLVTHNFGGSFVSVWQIWFFADALGMLIVTPTIVSLRQMSTLLGALPLRRKAECIVLLGLLATSTTYIFGSPTAARVFIIDFPAFLLLLVLWIALRFDWPFTSWTMLALAFALVALTRFGLGPFTRPETTRETVLVVQSFLAVGWVAMAFIAAVRAELTRTMHALQLQNQNLERTVESRTRTLRKARDEAERANKELRHAQSLLDKELTMARRVQESLLPLESLSHPGLKIYSQYIALHQVGGDFLDYYRDQHGGLGVLLADASGHGVPAALVASMSRMALENLRDLTAKPRDLLTALSESLRGKIGWHFLTACYLYFHPGGGRITYATAGHPPPFLMRPGEPIQHLDGAGTFVGIFPDPQFDEHSIEVQPGDRLLLFTDGILECIDTGDTGLVHLQRLLEELTSSETLDFTPELVTRIESEATEGFRDDVTIILMCIEDPAATEKAMPLNGDRGREEWS